MHQVQPYAFKALITFIFLLRLSVAESVSAQEKAQEETEARSQTSQISQRDHSLQLSNASPLQGETIKVTSTAGDAQTSPAVSFNGESIKMFPAESRKGNETGGDGTRYEALLAIPVLLTPGNYPVKVGNRSQTIHVQNAHFRIQNLTLPKDKDNFNASPGEKEEMNKAKATLTDTRMWNGIFEKPVSGARMSSSFGVRRRVNGKLLPDYFHSGADFAAGIGTPIKSVAPGVVIAARPHKIAKLHGNFVCIDHGQGVISIYIHMNSIDVKKGDRVEAGQKLGTVGRTGRANGPHLHFGIYVNQTATNPKFWFEQNF
ncbi:MAG: M23 family metallopeptidase [Cyanobacteria bacterium TGS_CYA1]|nr:M23 family metallopeptidase [Cyanobacteria bacterium TGS_CYA1]